jgi:hypothetical protein
MFVPRYGCDSYTYTIEFSYTNEKMSGLFVWCYFPFLFQILYEIQKKEKNLLPIEKSPLIDRTKLRSETNTYQSNKCN